MTDQSFTTRFTVTRDPAAVFEAINDVRGWWSGAIEGETDKVGESFRYHFQDLHRCVIRVDELVPGRRVAWTITDNHFSFTEDPGEWIGTRLVFEITPLDGGAQVAFTHAGLLPTLECYGACADGWHTYIDGSLRELIETGRGLPNAGEAISGSERELSR